MVLTEEGFLLVLFTKEYKMALCERALFMWVSVS